MSKKSLILDLSISTIQYVVPEISPDYKQNSCEDFKIIRIIRFEIQVSFFLYQIQAYFWIRRHVKEVKLLRELSARQMRWLYHEVNCRAVPQGIDFENV